MGDLTENFSRSEFACNCGCGYDKIDERIVNRLQLVRDIARVPIKVNSACRCLIHNAKVGGENGSYHLLGLAVDWCFDDPQGNGLLEKLCIKLIDNWSGGFHFYPQRTLPNGVIQPPFCHCDIGRRRRW